MVSTRGSLPSSGTTTSLEKSTRKKREGVLKFTKDDRALATAILDADTEILHLREYRDWLVDNFGEAHKAGDEERASFFAGASVVVEKNSVDVLENEYDELDIVRRRLKDGTWWCKSWAEDREEGWDKFFLGHTVKVEQDDGHVLAQFGEHEIMEQRMEDGTWKVKMLDAWEKDGWSDEYESSSYCSSDDEDGTQSDIDSETSACQVSAMAVNKFNGPSALVSRHIPQRATPMSKTVYPPCILLASTTTLFLRTQLPDMRVRSNNPKFKKAISDHKQPTRRISRTKPYQRRRPGLDIKIKPITFHIDNPRKNTTLTHHMSSSTHSLPRTTHEYILMHIRCMPGILVILAELMPQVADYKRAR